MDTQINSADISATSTVQGPIDKDLVCSNIGCHIEAMHHGLCAMCANVLAADRSARSIVYRDGTARLRGDVSADRIAARRARSKANADLLRQAAAVEAKLAGVRIKYGDDAVQDAYVKALAANSPTPEYVAYCEARGERANSIRSTRRRNDREMKYARTHAVADPTANLALTKGHDWWLLVADAFTFVNDGQAGLHFDAEKLADAIGHNDAAALLIEVAGALLPHAESTLVDLVDALSKRAGRRVIMGELVEAANNHVPCFIK